MPSQVSQWREPIAIVSMACRLPGGIDKPADLWDHVRAGRSSATAIPKDRFNAENFLSMDPNQKGAQAFRGAHFVQSDIKQFDHKFFGISKDTATAMDPQQKQLLEVVYECLESANIPMEKISSSKIGCYCAMFVSDYHDMLMQDPEYLPTFIAIGTTRTMLANRISHALDLGGPRYVVTDQSPISDVHHVSTAFECEADTSYAVLPLIQPVPVPWSPCILLAKRCKLVSVTVL
jgi:acyl transferase domain-containing protein